MMPYWNLKVAMCDPHFHSCCSLHYSLHVRSQSSTKLKGAVVFSYTSIFQFAHIARTCTTLYMLSKHVPGMQGLQLTMQPTVSSS